VQERACFPKFSCSLMQALLARLSERKGLKATLAKTKSTGNPLRRSARVIVRMSSDSPPATPVLSRWSGPPSPQMETPTQLQTMAGQIGAAALATTALANAHW